MGILNVTPDSFYDGGRYMDPGQALSKGLEMAEQGADILDVGAESTRPGAEPVDPREEWRRLGPIVGCLAQKGLAVSVDTYKADVARLALEAGAAMVNDISGGTMDPELPTVAASFGAALVVMHIRGTPRTMQVDPRYDDLMGEICGFLAGRAEAAVIAGVAPDSIVIDPGIGFGKKPEHNLEILMNLDRLRELGYPVLVGASRKSFIGLLTGEPPEGRLAGSIAVAAAAALHGAELVRVHDVRETRAALAVADALRRSRAVKR